MHRRGPENLSTDMAGLLGGFPKEADRSVLVIDFNTDQGKGFGLFYGNTEEEREELNKYLFEDACDPVIGIENRGEFFAKFSSEAAPDDKVKIFAAALIKFLNEHEEIKRLELKANDALIFIIYVAKQCRHLKQIVCPGGNAREQRDANDLLPANAEEVRERKERVAMEEARKKERLIPRPKKVESLPEGCNANIWKELDSNVRINPKVDFNKHSIDKGLKLYGEVINASAYYYSAYAFKKKFATSEDSIVIKTCLAWCKVNGVKKMGFYFNINDFNDLKTHQAFLKELEEDDNLEEIDIGDGIKKTFASEIQAQLKKNLAKRSAATNTTPNASAIQQPKEIEPKTGVSGPPHSKPEEPAVAPKGCDDATNTTPAQQPKKIQGSETKPLNSSGENSSCKGTEQNENLPVWNLLSCMLLGANVAMLLEGDALVKGVAFLATTGLSSVVALKASEEIREQPIIKYGSPVLLSLTFVAQAANLAR